MHKKWVWAFSAIVSLGMPDIARGAIELSGTVVGINEVPMASCVANLLKSGITVQTTPTGYFNFKNGAGLENRIPSISKIQVSADFIQLRLGAPIQDIHIKMLDLSGRTVFSYTNPRLSQGFHNLSFTNNSGPIPGMYFFQVRFDGTVRNQKVLIFSHAGSSFDLGRTVYPRLAKSAAVLDTLKITCPNYPVKSFPVSDLGQDLKTIRMAVTVCEGIRALAGKDIDASVKIQACIDSTMANGTVDLPPGIYRMDKQIKIQTKAMTLRTEGKSETSPKCVPTGHDCAELRASVDFVAGAGILRLLHAGSKIDHLVLNGTKTERLNALAGVACAKGGYAGYNMSMQCNGCSMTNSASINTLCGTGLEVTGKTDSVTVWRNTFAYNGVHTTFYMWSDGLTVHDGKNSTYSENEFIDNTDVDFIFGGCVNCLIQNNTLKHSDEITGGSFAGLMIHAWTTTSGDYAGSHVSNNSIDCGAKKRCGAGLYLGSDAWYTTDVFGGSVHDNTIKNAGLGVLIDDVHDMEVYNNSVSLNADSTHTNCGDKPTQPYTVGLRTFNLIRTKETLPVNYVPANWDGCIPNFWK